MRFVPPVAALSSATVRFDGDPHARTRPMAEVLTGLRGFGVRVDDDGRGTLPFDVVGRGAVRGGQVTIDASASSQFISALLLAGARYDEGVDVLHDGKPVPSLPHIEMTSRACASTASRSTTASRTAGALHPGPVAPWTPRSSRTSPTPRRS